MAVEENKSVVAEQTAPAPSTETPAPAPAESAPAAPVAEPAKVETAEPAKTEQVKVEPAKVEAEKAEPAKVESEKKESTVLGADKKPEADKKVEETDKKVETDKKPEADKKVEGDKKAEEDKKTEADKKNEGDKSDEPAPLPTYEAFKLPEDVTLDNKVLEDFTKDLAEYEALAKADHAETQKLGQKLVDRHIAEVKSALERQTKAYTDIWEKQKSDWYESFVKDPEIGGNRKDTTENAALEFINTHGGTEVHKAEFRKLMDTTGIGNHPALIRMFANAMEARREGKPLPASKPIPENRSKVEKRYGTTT